MQQQKNKYLKIINKILPVIDIIAGSVIIVLLILNTIFSGIGFYLDIKLALAFIILLICVLSIKVYKLCDNSEQYKVEFDKHCEAFERLCSDVCENETQCCQSIIKAYHDIFNGNKIDELRIYTDNTTRIVGSFSGTNTFIDECYILVSKIPTQSKLYDKESYYELINNIKKWKRLQDDGRINKLTICYYEDLPDSYSIIVNNERLITDSFHRTYGKGQADINGLEVMKNPVVFYSKKDINIKIIEKKIKQFDNNFRYYISNGQILLEDGEIKVCHESSI